MTMVVEALLPFKMPLFHFPCILQLPGKRPRNAMAVDLQSRFPSQSLPRRVLLKFIGFNSVMLCNCPVFAAPMPQMEQPQLIRTLKLDSGVRIQEIVEGEGPEAHEGDLVEFNYVCRRSNGYFVHSTVDQFSGESSPVILPLDENKIIKGLKEVFIGMKVGGKRRALVPPSAGYINENLKPIPDEVLLTSGFRMLK